MTSSWAAILGCLWPQTLVPDCPLTFLKPIAFGLSCPLASFVFEPYVWLSLLVTFPTFLSPMLSLLDALVWRWNERFAYYKRSFQSNETHYALHDCFCTFQTKNWLNLGHFDSMWQFWVWNLTVLSSWKSDWNTLQLWGCASTYMVQFLHNLEFFRC